jgi:predicted transcriptional regulator
MRKKEVYMLDENDEEIVDIFSDLGMPKNLAKTLIYISQVDECRSDDIEKAANLRQPEVSLAMQELLQRGWATKRDVKKKGKGRPSHLYKSVKNLPEIFELFKNEKLKKIEEVKKNISNLKELLEKR